MRAKISTHVSAQQSEKFIQPSSRLDRVKYLVKLKKEEKATEYTRRKKTALQYWNKTADLKLNNVAIDISVVCYLHRKSIVMNDIR